MKKYAMSLFAVAAFASTASMAASTGTITFEGALTDSSCNVSVNGGSASSLVTLPTISTGGLNASGEVAGRTAFTISLTGCNLQNGYKTVSVFFEAGPSVDVVTGRLSNKASTNRANNVELQLLDIVNGFNPIKVGSSEQTDPNQSAKNNGFVNVDANGNAAIPYAVQYYATDKTTAGKILGSVTYSIQYR